MTQNPPVPGDGTKHVPDGAPPTETQFVADGPAPTATQLVPDGPAPRARSGSSSGSQTQHVADLPTFGRFRALAELGSGAMGTVYRAQDEVLGRAVAIKALHSRDSGTRERFLREARAIGAVLHPNILAVYDAGPTMEAPGFMPGAGVADATPYLVMELAAGGSLRERMAAGPLPIETVRAVGIQIARALAAAHGASIVHRDVKPANILLVGEVWKLADFGIARLPDSTLTVEGQFLGSPSYAAPESLRAGQFSPASDVYGLGATLYEAVTGVPPHGDHDIRALVRKLEQDPPPVHTHRPVPAALDHAIMATLTRDPAARPSADELARMLAVTGSDAVSLPPLATAPQGPSTASKLLAIGLAVVAIVLVVIAVTRDEATGTAERQHDVDPREPLTPPVAKQRANDTAPKPGTRRDEPKLAQPPAPAEPSPSAEPSPPEAPARPDPWGHAAATVVDQYGNPVDDETARKILEQMEADARSEYEDINRGRGRWKNKNR